MAVALKLCVLLVVLSCALAQHADRGLENLFQMLESKKNADKAKPKSSGSKWDNSANRPLKVECNEEQGEGLVKVKSKYSKSDNDRQFKWECAVVTQGGQPLIDCDWSKEINKWNAPIGYACPANKIMSGVKSKNHPSKEDRKWKIKCCKANNHITKSCRLSEQLNTYHSDMDYSVKNEGDEPNVFVGLQSLENPKNDRLWQVYECTFAPPSCDQSNPQPPPQNIPQNSPQHNPQPNNNGHSYVVLDLNKNNGQGTPTYTIKTNPSQPKAPPQPSTVGHTFTVHTTKPEPPKEKTKPRNDGGHTYTIELPLTGANPQPPPPPPPPAPPQHDYTIEVPYSKLLKKLNGMMQHTDQLAKARRRLFSQVENNPGPQQAVNPPQQAPSKKETQKGKLLPVPPGLSKHPEPSKKPETPAQPPGNHVIHINYPAPPAKVIPAPATPTHSISIQPKVQDPTKHLHIYAPKNGRGKFLVEKMPTGAKLHYVEKPEREHYHLKLPDSHVPREIHYDVPITNNGAPLQGTYNVPLSSGKWPVIDTKYKQQAGKKKHTRRRKQF